MLGVESYALALLFYVLIGMIQGVSTAYFAASRSGTPLKMKGYYLLCGGIGLVYAILGLSVFTGGIPIYAMLPVIIVWWAGKMFGSSLFPVPDMRIGGVIICGLVLALFIYHNLL